MRYLGVFRVIVRGSFGRVDGRVAVWRIRFDPGVCEAEASTPVFGGLTPGG